MPRQYVSGVVLVLNDPATGIGALQSNFGAKD
jgi:hypothetical protein